MGHGWGAGGGRQRWWVVAPVVLALMASCSHRTEDDRSRAPRSVVVSGTATLDRKPFDADVVGAVVIDHGLVTPCQSELPPVQAGRYSIPVLSARAGTGCGGPSSKVVLWTFADDRILYSTDAVAWPKAGARVVFDPTFDSSSPNGAAPEVAQFNGAVYRKDGELAPLGTEVEAFVGDKRCGVASVRRSDTFVGYVLAVVGPESVPGCTRDATLTFYVDGQPTRHDPVANRPPGVREAVDLRL